MIDGSELAAPAARPKKAVAWTAVPVVVFAALALLFGLALRSGDPSKLPSALIGRSVPETVFPALDGLVDGASTVPGFSHRELARGRVSVVNFWASWCAPCVDEHPLLIELGRRAGVEIYGVNYKDDTAAARRFLGRYGNPFSAVGTDAKGRGAIEWGVYGMPETFVVNGKGEIVYKHIGPISRESLAGKILPAIEKASKPEQAK